MAGALDSYNREIMQTKCPTCGRQAERCKSLSPGRVIPSHPRRRAAAGYEWNPMTGVLTEIGES